VKIDKLTLPSGAGYVVFGDPDMLTGRDYRRMRACITNMDHIIEAQSDMALVMAEALVIDWQVDYLGNPPMLPRVNPDLLDQLRIGDARALEAALLPAVNHYVLGTPLPEEATDGDPLPPATVSG